MPTGNETPKQQYDRLVKDLTAGKHVGPDGRAVMDWASFPGEEGVHIGQRMVAVQYAGKEGGGGGLRVDFAFPPSVVDDDEDEEQDAADEKKPEPAPEPVKLEPVKAEPIKYVPGTKPEPTKGASMHGAAGSSDNKQD